MGGTSVAVNLHRMISEKFGFRGEFQITESLIMSAEDRALERDIEEAYRCGVKAVELARDGVSGMMVAMQRVSNDPYTIEYGQVPLNDVAVKAKPMPLDYFNEEGNFVSDKFLEYMKPLSGPLPEFVRLQQIKAQP